MLSTSFHATLPIDEANPLLKSKMVQMFTIDIFPLLPKEGWPQDKYLQNFINNQSKEQLHGSLFFFFIVQTIDIYHNLFLSYFPQHSPEKNLCFGIHKSICLTQGPQSKWEVPTWI